MYRINSWEVFGSRFWKLIQPERAWTMELSGGRRRDQMETEAAHRYLQPGSPKLTVTQSGAKKKSENTNTCGARESGLEIEDGVI